MKNLFLYFICIISINEAIAQQNEKMEIQGAIQISNTTETNPDPGTIRWNGSDY